MRNGVAPTLATLFVASAVWAASACSSFSASETPADVTDGMAEGAATDGPGGGSDGSVGPGGDASNAATSVYVIGGEIPPPVVDGGITLTNSVVFATQQADGTLGSWAETTPVRGYVHGNAAVASSGAIVTLAGEVQGPVGPPSAIDVPSRAAILGGGQLDGWMDTLALPDRIYFHAAVTVNGRVYVMGGHVPGKDAVSNVRFAPVAAEGSIGTWVETAALPGAPRERLAAATDGVHVFVVGGESAGQCATDVLVGTIGSTGEIATWASTGRSYVGQSPGVVVFANKLYILGGFGCAGGSGGSAAVQIAEIQPEGTLGTFTSGAALPSARSGLGAVVLGQHLYAIGGDDGDGPVTDVSVANLDGAGAFDAWHPGPPLPSGRSRFGIAAH